MVISNTEMYFQQDDDGNLLETEFGLSVYKDHQTFSIQVSLSRVIFMSSETCGFDRYSFWHPRSAEFKGQF